MEMENTKNGVLHYNSTLIRIHIAGHMYFLNDTLYFVECCGVIAAWEFMPLQQGWIHFMIWRRNPDTSTVDLVAYNTFLVVSKLMEDTNYLIYFICRFGEHISQFSHGINISD